MAKLDPPALDQVAAAPGHLALPIRVAQFLVVLVYVLHMVVEDTMAVVRQSHTRLGPEHREVLVRLA